MSVELTTITPRDFGPVADFLSRQMQPHRPASWWLAMMSPGWPGGRDRLGAMLRDGERVVGAYLAYYSERSIDGRKETICNLGTWCVEPEYRLHSLRLLKALLAADDYHFTDLSPNPDVIKLNERLGFRRLHGTRAALIPNLPWPSVPGGPRVSSDPDLFASTLQGAELEIFEAHREAPALLHSLVRDGDRHCYVVCRRDIKKGLPISTLLYAGDAELLRRATRRLSRHLLLHHRTLGCLIEQRFCAKPPLGSIRLGSPRTKFFRGPRLEDAQIDYLYSELACSP